MDTEVESASFARETLHHPVPGVANLSIDRTKVDPDEDDEWEYEYSGTETEVTSKSQM